MKFRIKYAQQVVGLFLLAGALALVVVLVFMGANQRWFARNYVFFSRFSSAEGITTGMSIRLKGFEIGKVTGVELNNLNGVRVEVAIFEDYYHKIRPDSVLDLAVSPLGIGGGSMNLLPALNMLPPMEERSFLPSSESTLGKALLAQGLVEKPMGNEAIAGIISEIQPTLAEIRATAAGATRFLGNFNNAVEGKQSNEISTLVKSLNRSLNTVDQVLATTSANPSGLLSPANQASISSMLTSMARLASQMEDPKGLVPKLLDPQGSLKTLLDDKNQLFNELSDLLKQANGTLAQVTSTVADLKGLTNYLTSSTPEFSGLLQDTQNTIKKAGDVMEGLSNNPLLKGGIPEKKAQTSTIQGQRDESF